jgi:voltage-gated potassium channel Kch
MNGLAASPLRNLASVVLFVLAIVAVATGAYMRAGWSFEDALYMVLLTVFTVGYGEVRPIDTHYLHVVTMVTMVFGCTGMILVTGAMVQVFTGYRIRQLLGINRVQTDIDKLKDHVIVCGFGRIGLMLAKELTAGGAAFVVLEKGDKRHAEVLEQGYLCLQGDATDETQLIAAGIRRAKVLATVLPDDAANVFITLSARSLNRGLTIIARGEVPSTESKLIQAGADRVVLPTHIGAERIAEMILYPQTARFIRGSDRMRDFEKVLRDLGMEMEMVIAAEKSAAAGVTVAELELRGKGAFFVVQIDRAGGETVTRPPGSTVIAAGDGLLVVGRTAGRSAPSSARPRRGPGRGARPTRPRPESTIRRCWAGPDRSWAGRLPGRGRSRA